MYISELSLPSDFIISFCNGAKMTRDEFLKRFEAMDEQLQSNDTIKPKYNIPPEIEPVKNQEPIDELRFDPVAGN